MTDQEQARKIVLAVKSMKDDEAVEFVTSNLKAVKRQGEISGHEHAIEMLTRSSKELLAN